jgi:hypothetical protein
LEKTIVIDGKSIRLKTSGALPLRFKAQFHKDYFSELMKLAPAIERLDQKKDELTAEDLAAIDFDVFYNIIWTLAKTADPSIPEPLTWLDEFEEFPIMDILVECQDMLISSIGTKKKVPMKEPGIR